MGAFQEYAGTCSTTGDVLLPGADDREHDGREEPGGEVDEQDADDERAMIEEFLVPIVAPA